MTPFKNRAVDPLRQVKVYRNLKFGKRSDPLWSVQQNGVVVAHAHNLTLFSVTFRINKKGQEQVRNTGRKNVHAYAVGYLRPASPGDLEASELSKIGYNPYEHDTFVRRDKDGGLLPVTKASLAVFSTDLKGANLR